MNNKLRVSIPLREDTLSNSSWNNISKWRTWVSIPLREDTLSNVETYLHKKAVQSVVSIPLREDTLSNDEYITSWELSNKVSIPLREDTLSNSFIVIIERVVSLFTFQFP